MATDASIRKESGPTAPKPGMERITSEMVLRAQSPDRTLRNEALGQIFQYTQVQTQRYLQRRLNGYEAIEEVESRARLKLVEKITMYEDRGFPFSAWYYRLLHNEMVDYLRQPNLTKSIEVLPEIAQPSSGFEKNAHNKEALKPAYSALTPLQMAAVNLRFLQGHTVAEAAAIMGVSEDAVKKLQARGLTNLRKTIEGDSKEPAETKPWVTSLSEALETMPFEEALALARENGTKKDPPIWVYDPSLNRHRFQEKRHQAMYSDLTDGQLQLGYILFPDPAEYPRIESLAEAGGILAIYKRSSLAHQRKSLATKLHTDQSPEELLKRPRKKELIDRLNSIPEYAYLTPQERDQVMWLAIDKPELDQIAIERNPSEKIAI